MQGPSKLGKLMVLWCKRECNIQWYNSLENMTLRRRKWIFFCKYVCYRKKQGSSIDRSKCAKAWDRTRPTEGKNCRHAFRPLILTSCREICQCVRRIQYRYQFVMPRYPKLCWPSVKTTPKNQPRQSSCCIQTPTLKYMGLCASALLLFHLHYDLSRCLLRFLRTFQDAFIAATEDTAIPGNSPEKSRFGKSPIHLEKREPKRSQFPTRAFSRWAPSPRPSPNCPARSQYLREGAFDEHHNNTEFRTLQLNFTTCFIYMLARTTQLWSCTDTFGDSFNTNRNVRLVLAIKMECHPGGVATRDTNKHSKQSAQDWELRLRKIVVTKITSVSNLPQGCSNRIRGFLLTSDASVI